MMKKDSKMPLQSKIGLLNHAMKTKIDRL